VIWWSRVWWLIGLVIAGSCAAVLLQEAGIRVNLSPSAPFGLFVASRVDTSTRFRRGMLVAVCLPARIAHLGRARRYLMRGGCPDGTAPVGKSIFAMVGDTVTVSDEGLALDGRLECHTRPLAGDSDGRPIPRIPSGSYAVAAGEIWLISTYTTRSWDSRYFGPVPMAGIAAALRPLWTIRTGLDEPAWTGGAGRRGGLAASSDIDNAEPSGAAEREP
jgi:conjugative transfer signal peptidase TraF